MADMCRRGAQRGDCFWRAAIGKYLDADCINWRGRSGRDWIHRFQDPSEIELEKEGIMPVGRKKKAKKAKAAIVLALPTFGETVRSMRKKGKVAKKKAKRKMRGY